AGAVISIAFYIVLYGPSWLFLPVGIVLALAFFWTRCRYRLLYGVAEFIAGAFALWHSYPIGRGAFSGTFNEAFQSYQWQVVFLTTLAGIYIMIRGLDNISQGWYNYWFRTV